MITRDKFGKKLKAGWIYRAKAGTIGIAVPHTDNEKKCKLHWLTTRLGVSGLDNSSNYGIVAVVDAGDMLIALATKIRTEFK